MSTNEQTASTTKTGMFVMADGKNLMFTFALVSSLFLLWGLCNGMIDVMDKHFQDELGLSKSQSAWVQFAHYLGYFLMAMPAGWLATRLGYKGGIIAGLLLVALGGFWFLPATVISDMWKFFALVSQKCGLPGPPAAVVPFIAFLTGVCAIAAGLTFLETIANPYTTVLGPSRYAATRINLAQSCNGIGWIFGPIIGSMFFYSMDEAGKSTGSETLFIPYVIVAVVVLALSVIFYFAYIPDIKTEDDYHLDDATPGVSHSIWSHPHFVGAVLAQFLYVAAQAGIFSFFINYMTAEVPPIPESCRTGLASVADASPSVIRQWLEGWIEINTSMSASDLQNSQALAAKLKRKSDPVSAYLSEQLAPETQRALAEYDGSSAVSRTLQSSVLQDLNRIVKKESLHDPKSAPQRFADVVWGQRTQGLMSEKLQQELKSEKLQQELQSEDLQPERRKELKQELSMSKKLQAEYQKRLNRMQLEDAYPQEVRFVDGILCISDKGASNLASLGFICFLLGRFSGAGILRRFSAHKILGFYGLMNVAVCFLVFSKLGWLSVACVFLSYFFMSIMFPTIFALGIFGLGVRAKKASAYIVMAIMGGALLPKVMGYVADQYDMSRGFIVPMACFIFVALYGYCWPKLSHADSLNGVAPSGGH